MPNCVRSIVLLAIAIVPTSAWAKPPPQACGSAPPVATPGIVWQGGERLGLREIAVLLAPTLWFSADEPLLAEGYPPIPSAHPCDAAAAGAVVYYQVTELTYRGDSPVGRPEEDDAGFADKVESFILKYYFYYPEDFRSRRTPARSRDRGVRGVARRRWRAAAACGSPLSRRSRTAAAGTRTR